MTFFCSSLVSAAVSGLLALDHLQAGQFMFSRPFFAGAVLGIICGCPAEGAAIGIAFEFLYSADLPLGSAVPPNGLAGAAAAVLGVKAGLMAAAAFFYGIFFAWAYSRADTMLRRMRSGWNIKAAEEISFGNFRPEIWIFRSMAADFAAMFIAVLSAGMSAMVICHYVQIPPWINSSAVFVYMLIPVMGIGMLYSRFKNSLKICGFSSLFRKTEKVSVYDSTKDFPVQKTFLRLFFVQAGWNYERFQNFGFLYSLMPFLKDCHKTDSGLKEAMSRNFSKINTNPFLSGLLAGASMKMEKDYVSGKESLERIAEIKNALASSAAASGDGIFWSSLRPLSFQIGLMVCLLCGFSHWLFGGVFSGRTAETASSAIGAAASVLAFSVPALIIRWRSLKAGLGGSGENLMGLKAVFPENLKACLDLSGFILSVLLAIEVFVFLFAKTRQMDMSPGQAVSRLALIAAMFVFGRFAAKGMPIQSAALALFFSAMLFSALGVPIYFF